MPTFHFIGTDEGSLRTDTHLETAAAPTNTKILFARKQNKPKHNRAPKPDITQRAFKMFYTSLLALWSHPETRRSYRTTPRGYLPCNYRQGQGAASPWDFTVDLGAAMACVGHSAGGSVAQV